MMMTIEATLTKPILTTLNIPYSPDQLSPAWLTAALRSTGTIGQATVTAMQIEDLGDVEGNTSQMVRVQLRYDQPEENAPASLIAKLPDADPNIRQGFRRMYEREGRFYESIAQGINLRTPTCYYNAMDVEQHDYILLLEDLAPAHQTGDQVTGCSLEQAKMAILGLAELHAPYWDSPLLDDLTWATTFPERAQTAQETYLQQHWPTFVEKYGQVVPDIIMEIGEAFGQAMPIIWDRLGQSPITLIHGDYRLDNLMLQSLEGGPSFAVVDWQMIKRGRGMVDVAYFLGWSVSTNMRRDHEMELLKMYHATLIQKGIQGYSFEQCLADYRQAMFYVFAVAVIALAILDMSNGRRATLAATMLERVAATVADHRLKDLLPLQC